MLENNNVQACVHFQSKFFISLASYDIKYTDKNVRCKKHKRRNKTSKHRGKKEKVQILFV